MQIIHASESQHWYARDGKPAYTVVGKNGQERPATLRDARTMDLVPSVTEIQKCAAKPGLEIYKIDQAVMAALTLPRLDGELDADFVRRVKQDAQEQAKKAAEAGTRMHAALQGHYEGKLPDVDLWPTVNAAKDAIAKPFGGMSWVAEKSFAHPLGYGGKTDLSRVTTPVVIDFKGRDFAEGDKIVPYDENVIQLAAYREGLGLPLATCANLFFSRTVPGLVHLHVWTELEVARGWEMFKALLSYWKSKNRYTP